jgi:tetrahydromethanopterin S-methyltransferase subunit E
MGIAVAVGMMVLVTILLWNKHSEPTADQRYGCTIEQRAPNGECK